jgi:hypothetical protein
LLDNVVSVLDPMAWESCLLGKLVPASER